MLLPLLLNNMMFRTLLETRHMQVYLSGGATNTNSAASLGGIKSTIDMLPDAVLKNLFDEIPQGHLAGGRTDYRCYYVFNDSGEHTWYNVEVYVQEETPSASTVVDIGLDPAGNGNGVSTGVATTVANDETAPGGVTFTHPTGSPGLIIGDLAPGTGRAVWAKRILSAGASAAPLDSTTLRHAGSDYEG